MMSEVEDLVSKLDSGDVRRRFAEEGRSARNLLVWSVPLANRQGLDITWAKHRKPPTSPNTPNSKLSVLVEGVRRNSKRFVAAEKPRLRSVSAGRDPKLDYKSRHWAFLFENLRRAVDEIHDTCETDESIAECKEAIMVLDNYTKDFHSLIEWIHLKQDFDSTPPRCRPTSLTWEMRRPSSRSNLVAAAFESITKPAAARVLKFDQDKSGTVSLGVQTDATIVPLSPELVIEINMNTEQSDSNGTKSTKPVIETISAKMLPKSLVVDKSTLDEKVASRSIQLNTGKKAILRTVKSGHRSALTNTKIANRKCSSSVSTANESKDSSTSSLSSASSGCQSWADRVRNNNTSVVAGTIPSTSVGTLSSVDELKQPTFDDDTDGWKMVQRVRTKSRTSPTSKIQIQSSKNISLRCNSFSTGDSLNLSTTKVVPQRPQSSSVQPHVATFRTRNLPTPARSLPSLHLLKTPERSPEPGSPLKATTSSDQQSKAKSNKKFSRRSQSPNAGSVKPSKISVLSLERDSKKTDKNDVEKNDPVPETSTTITEDELPYTRGMLWGEYMDHLDADPRPPGRVIELHEKLSSPSRKRSMSEALRRHEEKQAKAQEQRERFLEEKAQRGKEISKKVEEKRLWKEEVTQKRRALMELKLQQAEEKRRFQLQMIIRKAHDEEEKVNEIAFINSLEAQNKRHDVLSRIQGHEARLQDIQGERQRRQEEKAAKEAAAEEKRRTLEAERQAKLIEMQEKRKLKEHKIEQHQQEKEKERLELAREKARDREERLSALQAAQQATMEELQKKIQQKQEDSARRHEMNIEHIRQRALELSILRLSSAADDAPRLVPYDTKKLCTLCNVLIATEVYLLSHLRGKRHHQAIKEKHQGIEPSSEETESYNLKHIIDAPPDKLDPLIALDKERQKTLKKRCKKLRHKMINRSNSNNAYVINAKINNLESQNKMRIQRSMKEMARCLQNCGTGPWPTNIVASLDRSLGELSRIIEGKGQNVTRHQSDQHVFNALGGFQTLTQILNVILKGTHDLPTVIPSRTLVNVCNVYRLMCTNNSDNCLHVMQTNKMTGLLDFLIHRLNILIPHNFNHLFTGHNGNIVTSLPVDTVSKALMQLMATVHSVLAIIEYNSSINDNQNSLSAWIQDIIGYAVSVGIVDNLTRYFSNVRGPIDDDLPLSEFIQQSMSFLLSLTKLLSHNYCNGDTGSVFERCLIEDETQLMATLQITELVGTVSLLYGMLLHTGAPSRGLTPPPQLCAPTLCVTTSALHMLNNFALLDLQMFQQVVGAEGTSLQFRHIVSYLLWYCNHWTNDDLLHELILIVGYFTVLNQDNQIVIQSGHMPTVLQQLCLLPFQYFSDPSLVNILFPTIIACCFNNKQNAAILEQELSCDLLAQYIEEKKLDDANPPQLPNIKTAKDNNIINGDSSKSKWLLEGRFPRSQWDNAEKFFHSPSDYRD